MSAVIDTTVVDAQSLGYSSDERLISRLRAHDDSAFAQLVARYEHQLLSFCRRMLGSREDAEDVLQDTFAAAYKAILADERVIECRPWLYQIARNRCLNAIRGRRPTQSLSLDGFEPEVKLGTVEQVAHKLEIKLLVNDILALPAQQRQALVLHELEGCSYEQIAHHLGTSVASVRSLLLRARRTLLALAEGRALPCAEARAQLNELDGPTPAARRHLELCSDCAAYKQQRSRRSARVLRAISPLGALFALKQQVLPRIFRRVGVQAAAGGTGAAGAGSAATAGAGGAATAGAGLSAVAAKALAGLAVLAAAGTGTVVVQQVTSAPPHHAKAPAAASTPAATPVESSPPVTTPAPPVSPSSVHRTPTSKGPTTTTPSTTSTSGATQTTPPVTTTGQGTQGTTGVQTTSTPVAAQRTRPVPGAGVSPARTRPVPYQAPDSGRTFPQGSSTGTGPNQGSSTGSSSGTGSGEGSSTGTDSGQGSSTGSGQSSSGKRSSLSSLSGTGTTDLSGSSTQSAATS